MLTSITESWQNAGSGTRIFLTIAVVIALHFSVILVRRVGLRVKSVAVGPSLSKSRTISSLAVSALGFALYFIAIGLILRELGISLTAYLASASIVGLAIGFGSQGFVQDVVTGLTIVFADLFDVGDMVELAGQTGIVHNVGLRFTMIENAYGARVYIPNRTIGNVVNYPRGYMRGFADVTLPNDADLAGRIEEKVGETVSSMLDQLPGILMAPPTIAGHTRTSAGKEFLRVKFRVWPGRGAPIETVFKQELVESLRALDPTYAAWMVTVNYEIERKAIVAHQFRKRDRQRARGAGSSGPDPHA